jgi:quaternary ammonium compound-resistance protein SugE
MHMAWLILFLAGLFEVGWALGLKLSDGFTRFWPSTATAASMAASVVLLGIALKQLPLGTAYAVWTGIGAIGTAVLGIVLFGEPTNFGRLVSIALIVAGIAGLKLASPDEPAAALRPELPLDRIQAE